MLAPHIKEKVNKLWDRFWSAGLTNPLVAVEQITYLLFLKRLEDIDDIRVSRNLPSIYDLTDEEKSKIAEAKEDDRAKLRKQFDASTCRWSYIRQLEKTNPRHLSEVVFPWLRTIDSRLSAQETDAELGGLDKRMADAYFQLDPNKGQVLGDAIDLIDQLFARAGDGSAAQDIMGDTFEYLLSEMATAGKNGQFRTPRHLIRFMVELLDPEPGNKIIDPAAGTGGFLFSAQQYLMRKYSAQDTIRLEWDGTPHRLDGAGTTTREYAEIHNGANFVGLDNDRTMTRIGWMNLILHDIADPQLVQGDSLSKREGKAKLAELLTPESYRFVLANPPFTGTVDTADLEEDSVLFPRIGGGGKKNKDTVTNKSELLFLWLMLDLLDISGRCAVIIPEGVLFGNTDAHKRLRRELLTEHVVEAVISLPGGVFQPYTGVKTSILIFRKETIRNDKQTFTGQAPRTDYVWFYEIERDGLTLDAKRTPRPGQDNDLWDALVKFKAWLNEGRAGSERLEKTYWQPTFQTQRWRQALLRDSADQLTAAGSAFADQTDTGMWDGQVWGIHELFPEIPSDPKAAEAQIKAKVQPALLALAKRYLARVTREIWAKWHPAQIPAPQQALDDWQKAIKNLPQEFRRAASDAQRFFENEDSPALPFWKDWTKEALNTALTDHENIVTQANRSSFGKYQPVSNLSQEMEALAREVAKLDGFDVVLRSLAIDQQTSIDTAKHWVVPVRNWLQNEDWQSADGKLQGSHDASGLVRSEYVQAILDEGLYDDKGNLKDGLLDPDCIEARDWNLSAGQYKPFDFTQLKCDKSVVDLIGELRETEQQFIGGLDKLLAMVEGRE
ncbi:type I restriction-modification system subunit M [Methylicorpusculum sp.]|uniref:type I restriction-modification system subunit M n=1 Tax=Methylicorpusculum sp. TaxID=2713644 RepID=UPI00273062E4|nr:class I SAM-dependent DNA methyltransferase [Methylicorpusculum sp.]MDP2177201.1 class I SAM-dependent DNA methyltransferase [Methylicorpusculum sp.]MDP3531126.1 class I SAM-dependent DNA methyltransferase [Methylicorpusculum sp.]MDZ4151213.1 class I SAM-dependent DNA methyltransferase [Methylicorpusculum sp.]